MKNIFRRSKPPKSSIPDSIDVYLRGRVPIVQENLADEQWGLYDPKRHRIVINQNLDEMQKHVVLINQFLEMTRDMLPVHTVGEYTQAAPMVLIHLMVEAGLYRGLTPEQVRTFIAEATDAEAAAQ